jgi:hypothetical protein
MKIFQNFHFKVYLWHKWIFPRPPVAKFIKSWQNYLFTLTKNSHILCTTTWRYGPP